LSSISGQCDGFMPAEEALHRPFRMALRRTRVRSFTVCGAFVLSAAIGRFERNSRRRKSPDAGPLRVRGRRQPRVFRDSSRPCTKRTGTAVGTFYTLERNSKFRLTEDLNFAGRRLAKIRFPNERPLTISGRSVQVADYTEVKNPKPLKLAVLSFPAGWWSAEGNAKSPSLNASRGRAGGYHLPENVPDAVQKLVHAKGLRHESGAQ